MNSAHGYSEGAEVPEDKTPQSKELRWIEKSLIEAHNKAIDECISIIENNPGDINLIPLLESLKNKPI